AVIRERALTAAVRYTQPGPADRAGELVVPGVIVECETGEHWKRGGSQGIDDDAVDEDRATELESDVERRIHVVLNASAVGDLHLQGVGLVRLDLRARAESPRGQVAAEVERVAAQEIVPVNPAQDTAELHEAPFATEPAARREIGPRESPDDA